MDAAPRSAGRAIDEKAPMQALVAKVSYGR
jgi:hypothetical protein